MKWIRCACCQRQYPVADDEVIQDWEPCEYCGRSEWVEVTEEKK